MEGEFNFEVSRQIAHEADAPVSWLCVDCGVNTAPGLHTKAEIYQHFFHEDKREGITNKITAQSEVYTVRDAVWAKAGYAEGCLCIGCLEKRLGRRLKRKDFPRDDPFNSPRIPGTKRLLDRRG